MVLGYYATAGVMAAGFGMMFGGPSAAGAMIQLFFVRPVQLVLGTCLTGFGIVLSGLWSGFVNAVSMLGRALRREFKELAADLRWVVRRFDR
jgi:hypothetical protein